MFNAASVPTVSFSAYTLLVAIDADEDIHVDQEDMNSRNRNNHCIIRNQSDLSNKQDGITASKGRLDKIMHKKLVENRLQVPKPSVATDSIDSEDAIHLHRTLESGNPSAPACVASPGSKISLLSSTKVKTAILPPPPLTSVNAIEQPTLSSRRRKVSIYTINKPLSKFQKQQVICPSIENIQSYDNNSFIVQRKQRAHTVIPVLPSHRLPIETGRDQEQDSLNALDASSSSTDQIEHFLQKDVTAPTCTSAVYGFVDHPNYNRHKSPKNQEYNSPLFRKSNWEQEQQQQHQRQNLFYPSDCFMPGLTKSSSNPSFSFTKVPLSIKTTTSPSIIDCQEGFSNDYLDQHSEMTYPPPPPAPEIDPAATAASYGAYTTTSGNGSTGYTVDENGHHVQHLPPLSEALHPDDAAAGGASTDHLGAQNAHYGAHTANVYDPHHTTTSNDGSAQHGHYDHQSSNFFDTQIMEPPPPADATAHHHAATAGLHGNGTTTNGNNGYGSSSTMMTPPPPASSHGYASSPYQSGGSAPLFHRASISGPVMHSHYPPPPGTPTTAHGADAWSSTPAAARPHTADGMFASQMGGMPGQWASVSDYNRGPRGSIGSISDAAPNSGSSKVFSYMPSNGDDSSSTAGSQGHQTSGGPRKRPRRRYDEIERLYSCSWPGCQKSYGTLNHLNAHVAMQKHGPKRSPAEFKDMRKAWRKSKREDEQRRQANAAAANEEALSRSKMVFAAPNQPFMTHTNYPVNNFMPPPTSSQANNAMAGGGNGQVPRYHPQSGMYTGYSHVGALDTGARNGGFATNAQAQGSGAGGLGAYLMAHRGSI